MSRKTSISREKPQRLPLLWLLQLQSVLRLMLLMPLTTRLQRSQRSSSVAEPQALAAPADGRKKRDMERARTARLGSIRAAPARGKRGGT